jgi:hypothetical protein
VLCSTIALALQSSSRLFVRKKKLKAKRQHGAVESHRVRNLVRIETMMRATGPAGTCGSTWRLRPGAASLVAHVLLNSFASPLLQLAKVRPWSAMDGTVVASMHACQYLRIDCSPCVCVLIVCCHCDSAQRTRWSTHCHSVTSPHRPRSISHWSHELVLHSHTPKRTGSECTFQHHIPFQSH